MSEPMSSVEIEDVLSSIRRLVSEDFRPSLRHAAQPPAGDKLILTPALRVVSNRAPNWDEGDDWYEESRAEVVLEWAVEPVPEPQAGGVGAPVTEAPMAEDVAGEVPEPQILRLAEPVPPAYPVVAEDSIGFAELFEEVYVSREALAPGEDPAPAWAQEDPGETEQVAEARPEPVFVDPSWADSAAAEAIARLEQHEEAELFAEAPEMTFDEAVLRDLVRDLIREEMQGGLGEKITRNVRKLVRAEISRVLAARDFD